MKVIHNHADWDAFAEMPPEDFHGGKEVFYTLAQATCSIVNYSAKWGAEALPEVLLELFKTPEPWEQDNVAGFLLFCSERVRCGIGIRTKRFHCYGIFQVILIYLKSLLDKPYCVEHSGGSSIKLVAFLLVDMIRVSHRFENYLNHEKGIGKIFDQILDYPTDSDRKAYLRHSVWSVIGSYLENGVDENEDMDFIDVVKNIGKHLMSGAYTKLCPQGGQITAKVTEDGDGKALMSEE